MRHHRILAFLTFSFIRVVQTQNNGTDLNRCGKEGEEKKLLAGWSICHNGRYVPSACQADDGSKVDIGLTVRQRNFIFECIQTSDSPTSPLALRQISCLRSKDKPDNPTVVDPGQRIRDPPFVYECVKLPPINPNLPIPLALKAVACANATSDIADGGTVVVGDYTYTCTRQSGSLTDYTKEVFLQPKGCLGPNGKEYLLNTQALIGDFAYRCQSTQTWPPSMQFAAVGCAAEGHRYDENEKFYTTKTDPNNGRFVMQCRRFNDTWSLRPIGCLEEHAPPIEHLIGDTWIDNGGPGDPRLKYIVECRGDSKSIRVISVQCVYQPNPDDSGSAKTISPGCYKKFTKPNALVKCSKGGNDNQSASVELISKLSLTKAEQDAIAAGFRAC